MIKVKYTVSAFIAVIFTSTVWYLLVSLSLESIPTNLEPQTANIEVGHKVTEEFIQEEIVPVVPTVFTSKLMKSLSIFHSQVDIKQDRDLIVRKIYFLAAARSRQLKD